MQVPCELGCKVTVGISTQCIQVCAEHSWHVPWPNNFFHLSQHAADSTLHTLTRFGYAGIYTASHWHINQVYQALQAMQVRNLIPSCNIQDCLTTTPANQQAHEVRQQQWSGNLTKLGIGASSLDSRMTAELHSMLEV
jgi:hypothetical protein